MEIGVGRLLGTLEIDGDRAAEAIVQVTQGLAAPVLAFVADFAPLGANEVEAGLDVLDNWAGLGGGDALAAEALLQLRGEGQRIFA